MAVIGFLPSSKSRFSYNQLQPKLAEIDRQAQLADAVEDSLRTPFQKQAIHLREVVVLYQRLKFSLQLPDSPDFLGELVQFQKALPAGVAAVRAKQRREALRNRRSRPWPNDSTLRSDGELRLPARDSTGRP